MPFVRRQLSPVQTAGEEILALVADHAKKGIVGLNNSTLEVCDNDADDVGVDESSDTPRAFGEIAAQASILDRHRCLRREEFQQGDARGGENMRCAVVLEVQQAGQLGAAGYWQAEQRTNPLSAKVRVCRKM